MHRSPRIVGTTAALILLALVAACGGSRSSDGAASSSSGSSQDAADTTGLGEPTSSGEAGSRRAEWLFALTADSATASDTELTLRGTSPTVVAFTDRPERASRVLSTPGLLLQWPALFAGDPPNAAISGTADGAQVESTVEIVAASPGASPGEVRLGIRSLGSEPLPASLADVTLVVDDVQLGSCTPRLAWYDQLEMPVGLAEAVAAAVRFELDASTSDAPLTFSLTVPAQLQVSGPDVGVSVSASTSAGPVDYPGGLVTLPVGGAQVSVPAPDEWVGSGRTATGVTASMSMDLADLAGASFDCTATASLAPG